MFINVRVQDNIHKWATYKRKKYPSNINHIQIRPLFF